MGGAPIERANDRINGLPARVTSLFNDNDSLLFEFECRLGCIDLVVEILIKKMNGQQRENWSNVVSEMDAHSLCTSFSFFFFY